MDPETSRLGIIAFILFVVYTIVLFGVPRKAGAQRNSRRKQ
jgi:hypothetical protein